MAGIVKTRGNRTSRICAQAVIRRLFWAARRRLKHEIPTFGVTGACLEPNSVPKEGISQGFPIPRPSCQLLSLSAIACPGRAVPVMHPDENTGLRLLYEQWLSVPADYSGNFIIPTFCRYPHVGRELFPYPVRTRPQDNDQGLRWLIPFPHSDKE